MRLEEKFTKHFGHKHTHEFFAPGRINLIGEHIDYSGGLVLPCAITMGTKALVSKRDDNELHFYSLNMDDLGVIRVSLDDIVYDKKDNWVNYTKGMFKKFEEAGHKASHGLNIAYYGDIPYASGLSSSASIEMVTGVIINDLFNFDLEMLEIVKLAQKVENEFIGVSSGIMDQFAIGFGKEEMAILLNTNTLDYEYIPLDLKDNSIVIMNTNKKRGLADSAYNERRAQCDSAFDSLKDKFDIKYLCDLSTSQLEASKDLIADEVEYRRARHAISENERTLEASNVLKSGDLEKFGKLMNESHISLRDDYEVTGIELDTLAETAWKQTGCLGARVTGAGFGGCAIAIVENNQVDNFIENVGEAYVKEVGYKADFYVAQVGDGAKQIG